MKLLKGLQWTMRKLICLVLVACMVPLPFPGRGVAAAESMEEVQLLIGDIYTLPTKSLSRVSITDPAVADISDAQPNGITLMGKQTGQTVLFVWDSTGKRIVMVRVMSEDLPSIKMRMESLFKSAKVSSVNISESQQEGKLVLTGDIPEDEMDTMDKIISPFSDQLINLTKREDSEDLVQIDMQITELSTTLAKEMGVSWATQGETLGNSIQQSYTETLPEQTGKIKDLFKLGDFARTTPIMATVTALIKQGKARILAKPRLVVKSGKEATFLVGGEIPISTTTTSSTGGAITENIEFKEYGVSMSITPTIKKGKIDITLNVEISDVDASKPAGKDLAFLTRSAQTQLFLDDKQTIVLAGLIKSSRSESQDWVPFLGKIPVLGMLFRHKSWPTHADSEVVISLTPTVLHTKKPVEKDVTIIEESKPPFSPEPQEQEAAVRVNMVPSRDTEGIPAIAKNAAMIPTTVPQGVAPYAQMVQTKISSSIAYPYEAQQNGWQGTVKLAMVVKKDGSLRDVYVKESSGYEIFDQDAINTAQILAPYDAFPSNVQDEELFLTIPIVYSLDSFLKNVAKRN